VNIDECAPRPSPLRRRVAGTGARRGALLFPQSLRNLIIWKTERKTERKNERKKERKNDYYYGCGWVFSLK